METNKAGIDYGRGTVNVDLETGIRYGVISQNTILQAWADSSEAVYPSAEDVGAELDEDGEPVDGWADDLEAIGYEVSDNEYKMESGTDGFGIFVLKSPYYARVRFCSPCAPGAGDLDSPCEDGIKAYCPGPDWFDEPPAFPIYRVSDGSRVEVVTQ